MTRKDFQLIADVFNGYADEQGVTVERDALAYKMADALATTNPSFNRSLFLKACGVL